MGTQLRKFKTNQNVSLEYDWVNKINKTKFFYDLCQTVTDYHYVYNENLEDIFQYSEYNDYTPEEGGYTTEEWMEILDFIDYEDDCEEIMLTDLERENFYRRI